MKKLLLILISTNIYADVVTSTIVQPPSYARANYDFTNQSNHTYSITNLTTTDKTYNICYMMQVCSEFPYYVKSKKVCQVETVKPYANIQGKYTLLYTAQMPFSRVSCTIYATTEITNSEYNISFDQKMMEFL